MDYKFWLTFTTNVLGVGFMAWQIRLMKNQIASLPSPRSTKRAAMERSLTRRLYLPVLLMASLVLVSWLPYVFARQPSVLPSLITGWSGFDTGCVAQVNTAPLVDHKNKYRVFLACRIFDSSVDEMEDEKIAISRPFNIAGDLINIAIPYDPNSKIVSIAKPGTNTNHFVFILPIDKDGSQIKKLSDVPREGGQILLPGVKLQD